jgi:hypothetical protein
VRDLTTVEVRRGRATGLALRLQVGQAHAVDREISLRWLALWIAFDSVVVLLSHLVMLMIRFDGVVSGRYWYRFWLVLPWIAGGYVMANFLGRAYEPDSGLLRRAAIAGFGAWFLINIVHVLPHFLPRSIPLVGGLIAVMGLIAIRLAMHPSFARPP